MTKFIIHTRVACWVTYRHMVEADTPEEAKELYKEGSFQCAEPEIGDSIEFLDQSIHVTPL